MKKSILFTLAILLFFYGWSSAEAFQDFQLKPSIKFGSQNMSEEGDRGSRSFIGIGLQCQKSSGSLDYWAGISGDAYFEAPDEKLSAPTQRLGVSLGARYNDAYKIWGFSFSPFASVGWNNWNRNIPADPLYAGRFEEMQFLSARGGVSIGLNRFFLEIGPTFPLWSDTDKGHDLSGRLGFAAFLGMTTKVVDLGLFYDSLSFGDDKNSPSKQPGFTFSEIGFKAVFKF